MRTFLYFQQYWQCLERPRNYSVWERGHLFHQYGGQDYVVPTTGWDTCPNSTTDHCNGSLFVKQNQGMRCLWYSWKHNNLADDGEEKQTAVVCSDSRRGLGFVSTICGEIAVPQFDWSSKQSRLSRHKPNNIIAERFLEQIRIGRSELRSLLCPVTWLKLLSNNFGWTTQIEELIVHSSISAFLRLTKIWFD